MRVLYIYRNDKAGPSIRRVFEPIEEEISRRVDVESIKLPFAKTIRIIDNISFVIRFLHGRKFDVIHITGDSYYLLIPLSLLRKKNGFRIVVTVHDLGHYTQHNHSIKHFFYHWLWISPINKADHITFISTKSMEEGRTLLKLNNKCCSVVYNPFNEAYQYQQKEDITTPVILQVGTKPNKNLTNVILALEGVSCHLRLIGKLNPEQKTLLAKCHIDYSYVHNISDEEMIEEYKNCSVVSFPSLYEGFGMPIIEGQAIGRVVVTSKIEPMIEISGGASILVNPLDIEDMRKGYELAMRSQKEYVDLGRVNILRFSPKKISEDYFNIYQGISNS